MFFCQLYFDKAGKKAIIAHRKTNHMAEFEIINGERGQSVEETVKWNLRRLRGMDIWDEVLITTKDGSTRRGTVLDHERDIENSGDGTVRIGSRGEVLIIPVQSVVRVTTRRAERISANHEGKGGEDFFANTFGEEVRRGVGTVLGGRQGASGERVSTDGHGEIVGGAGGRKRRVVDGQISGRDGNVVYARFGKAK